MASPSRHPNQNPDKTKTNYIKSTKPYLNYTMLIGILVFVAISASIIYSSYASTAVKFPTQANRVLVELQDGHADGPIPDTLKPAEVVNFRLYGNGLAVCGKDDSGQYTSRQLDKGALNAFMVSFKKAGFDKVEDNLSDSDTPFTTAEASTIKVNFAGNFRKASYSRHRLNEAPAAIKNAKATIDKFCSQTTQAYTPDKIVVRTKVTKKPVVTTKSRPSALKKETFKASADPQQTGAEVVSSDKTKQVVSELSVSQAQVVKDGSTNYEIITDPILPDVDEGDQVVAYDGNKVLAASQVPVQVIEFFPQGWGPAGGDLERLNAKASAINGFYRYQIQGSTFNMLPPKIVAGSRDLNYYLTYCGDVKQIGGCARGSLNSVLYGIYETDGAALGVTGKATLVYLPFQVNDPTACGSSFFPQRRFGVIDHFTSRCGNPGDPNVENTTMAHELGHTFGLNHSPNEYIYDIMNVGSPRCNFGPPSNCWLNDGYRVKLATPLYFENDPVYTAGMINIHRIYFPSNGGKHLYTNTITEVNGAVRGGWYWESVAWKAYPAPVPGARQLMRFYNTVTGDRLMTIDDGEKNNIQPPRGTWIYEANPIMYVMPNATATMNTPVTRLYKPSNGDHIYATDAREVSGAVASGWVNEGVRFWVQR